MSENLENHNELTINPTDIDNVAKDSEFGNNVIDVINDTKPTAFPVLNEDSNEVAKDFLASIENHKSEIMNHYPDITEYEYNEIAKRSIWILYQESKAGDAESYWHRIKWKEWWVHWFAIEVYKWITWEPRSRWYTQIKYETLFNQDDKEFLKNFEITSGEDFTDPKKCWIWTMVWLISNYLNIIVPMKSDPFWTNDAEITRIRFKNGKMEDVAKWRNVTIQEENGTTRLRTEEDIQNDIKKWSDSNWGIDRQETITRPWFSEENFFDALYYTWNRPFEIKYWTITFVKGGYAAKCMDHVSQHLNWTVLDAVAQN